MVLIGRSDGCSRCDAVTELDISDAAFVYFVEDLATDGPPLRPGLVGSRLRVIGW